MTKGRFIPSTKARTLAGLSMRLRAGRILPLVYFQVAGWREDPDGCLERISSELGAGPWIVRSSARAEDSAKASQAGRFRSVQGVTPDTLRAAIEKVVDSYGSECRDDDEVLVQPMLEGVSLFAVVLTHDPATGSPYRVVSYSLGTDTASVTAGSGHPRTCVTVRRAKSAPTELRPLLAAVDEIEDLCGGLPLDVECAVTSGEALPFVLQARPLVLREAPMATSDHRNLLGRVEKKIRSAQRRHPFLRGRSTVFGVMPDWNPAEIIGVRPRPLALSLYRDLVTDAIWAYQRHNYGYRNLRSFPLLVNFAGQPYIDVRVSFNSFIPRDIDGGLADRLVDHYVDCLVAAPTLHDKVEFEIVLSCYSLDLPQRLESLRKAGFTETECEDLAESLRRLTNRIIDRENGLWRTDADKLAILSGRREEILATEMDPVARIYWLLEDCKRYGTLPFAGLARAGFIAVQFLRSLVAVGVFSTKDYERFMRGLNTVSSQLAEDLERLERSDFLAKYGHLRPGTYDILSPRYDEAPDEYLGSGGRKPATRGKGDPFSIGLEQMRSIARLLGEHGLSSDVVGLMDFLQSAIELREYAKFVFTRNLSDALALFDHFGRELGFERSDLAYANIACIRELYAGADDARGILARSIEEGRERYEETRRLWLPPLITDPEQVFAFELPESEPNFITQGAASGPVVRPEDRTRLGGGIVFIASADPGFDWLFSHEIAGLVTAYGGANSHMAIRASELGLPAVIGAGEAHFGRWAAANRLRIDCANRTVQIVS